MNRLLRNSILTFLVISPWAQLCARDVTLIAGTLVQCTVNEPNFSSRTAKNGEPLVCYARPSHEFGCAAFPRGTVFAGRLADFRNPGRLYGKGWMQLEFDRVIVPEGQAPITAKVISVHGLKVDSEGKLLGRGHARRDVIEWAIPVLWPLKLATLLSPGPAPSLKGEKVMTLRLLDDVQVPCGDSFGTGWRRFGPSSSNHPDTSPSKSGIESAGSFSAAQSDAQAVGAGQEPSDSDHDRPLVIESGHHRVLITSSRLAKVETSPAARSGPD